MRLVGLTGGIATGKSTVSTLLESCQISIVDCDKIAKSVVQKGRWGYRRVVQTFGTSILQADGEVDRDALGALAFNNREARRALNHATHPAVLLEIIRQLLLHWLACKWLVVVDMPLLFETGAYRLLWPRVLVTCSSKVQLERLMRRDKCFQQLAEAKVAAQMPLERKAALADQIVENSGDRAALESQVRALASRLKRSACLQGPLTSPIAAAALALLLLAVCVMR
ncbi:hypothetical protein WJX81_000561 [Elliptochloris bilobata]|uniref:Dephospho-CoA kinase n=1 Tax=Elliptochloris bilobata TaxID=381761 RepID=A0AAW1RCH7_9CHLO